MPYVEGRTIHDADSHVMEMPEKILEFIETKHVAALKQYLRPRNEDWEAEMEALHQDPDFISHEESQLLLRKNHEALGSFRKEDRSRTLDYLGFASQLVFTTDALSNYNLETGETTELALAAARAHNRMMIDFCTVDQRLLPTAYVPLLDIEAAPRIAEEALKMGASGLMIPSTCPPGHSPSHVGFEPLWSLAEEAGVPILFHVGGEEKMNSAYMNNGLPQVLDFHGGAENFTSASYMTIPLSVWQTLSVLILDGVLDRHQNLMFGAIELGASWVPSWMRFMDAGAAAFMRGEERLQKLSAKPSEIVRRQFRVTPYPHEPTNWIIENTGPEICMFSSDFPHVEGGRNPLKRFGEALGGVSEADQHRFYRDNFIDLMGRALPAELHDLPGAA